MITTENSENNYMMTKVMVIMVDDDDHEDIEMVIMIKISLIVFIKMM